MKSYENVLKEMYDGIFRDAVARFPGLSKEFSRDNQRLSDALTARGIHLYTVDLPNLGKYLERCLAKETSVSSEVLSEDEFRALPFRGTRKGSPIPRLFGGLWSLIFDSCTGRVMDNPEIDAVFFLRQLYYAAKKLKIQCPDKAVFKAVRQFAEIEEEMRLPSLDWDADILELEPSFDEDFRSACAPRDLHLTDGLTQVAGPEGSPLPIDYHLKEALSFVQTVCDVVSTEMGILDVDSLNPKHGPGVVADAKKGDKYQFPTWPQKLENTFSSSVFACTNFNEWVDVVKGLVNKGLNLHEAPSKLIQVPKTQKGPRLIAAEPTSHQWCQQALKDFIESSVPRTMLRSSVAFGRQEHSRERALTASATLEDATIDLSSASDRLSAWFVERALRRNPGLLRALHATRTRCLVNSIDKKSAKQFRLKKFAPQGAAVTFPVQTILYSCVCIGVLTYIESKYNGINNRRTNVVKEARKLAPLVRVFGDDIIVPTYAYSAVVEVLQYLGLRVNRDKSFWTGRFRESCGMDAFAGYDVTPAYVTHVPSDKSPESVIAFVDTINNFYGKGLWHTSKALQSYLERHCKVTLPVIRMDSGLFGLKSYTGNEFSRLKSRYNSALCRTEYLVTVPSGTVERGDQPGESSLMQFFTVSPEAPNHWSQLVKQLCWGDHSFQHGWIKRAAVKTRLRWTFLAA